MSKGKCDWAGGKGRSGVCPRTELGGRSDPGSDPVAPSIKDSLRQGFLNCYPQVLRELAENIDPRPQPLNNTSFGKCSHPFCTKNRDLVSKTLVPWDFQNSVSSSTTSS